LVAKNPYTFAVRLLRLLAYHGRVYAGAILKENAAAVLAECAAVLLHRWRSINDISTAQLGETVRLLCSREWNMAEAGRQISRCERLTDQIVINCQQNVEILMSAVQHSKSEANQHVRALLDTLLPASFDCRSAWTALVEPLHKYYLRLETLVPDTHHALDEYLCRLMHFTLEAFGRVMIIEMHVIDSLVRRYAQAARRSDGWFDCVVYGQFFIDVL
jgi:hypothetical protein